MTFLGSLQITNVERRRILQRIFLRLFGLHVCIIVAIAAVSVWFATLVLQVARRGGLEIVQHWDQESSSAGMLLTRLLK